jgi:hypothetical protein
VQFGLVVLSLTGGTAMLARAALIVVMVCCLAAPLVSRMRSFRGRPGPENPADLDALWEHYKRGEISWDEYLRGEVEGARGLIGTRAQMPTAKSWGESTSDDTPFS